VKLTCRRARPRPSWRCSGSPVSATSPRPHGSPWADTSEEQGCTGALGGSALRLEFVERLPNDATGRFNDTRSGRRLFRDATPGLARRRGASSDRRILAGRDPPDQREAAFFDIVRSARPRRRLDRGRTGPNAALVRLNLDGRPGRRARPATAYGHSDSARASCRRGALVTTATGSAGTKLMFALSLHLAECETTGALPDRRGGARLPRWPARCPSTPVRRRRPDHRLPSNRISTSRSDRELAARLGRPRTISRMSGSTWSPPSDAT